MSNVSHYRATPAGGGAQPSPSFTNNVSPRDASQTVKNLFENAASMAASGERVPDVPEKAWATLDEYARTYNGDDNNTRELNEARAKLTELQRIIDLVNKALSLLPPDLKAHLLRELFSQGVAREDRGSVNHMLDDLFWVNNPKDVFSSSQPGTMLATLLSGESSMVLEHVLGRLDDSGDYKPSTSSLDDLVKTRTKVEERLYRLFSGMGGDLALAFPAPTTMSTAVESFTSAEFAEGFTFSVRDADGEVVEGTEHISSNQIRAQIKALEAWVGGLDDDKRERLEALLTRLPGLVETINEALRLAEGGDRSAYIAMFLGAGGEPKFSGDNAELNASNVGKLIAAVMVGDLEALKKFADMNHEEINEIALDFIKVEGEFRQTRDIAEDENQAAKDHFNNVVRPQLSGEEPIEKSRYERQIEEQRKAAQRA